MAGPNSKNQYTPQNISLDGGLDFITPKVAVPGGTLSGCLNFERTDRWGYSRIKGYEYYDGGSNASLTYTNLVNVEHENTEVDFPVRTALKIQGRTKIMGTVVERTSGTITVIAVVNFDEWRLVLAAVNAGDSITIEQPGGDALIVTGVAAFDNDPNSDAKLEMEVRNALFKSIRDVVGFPGPANKPIIGLRGFKNKIYAIKDMQTFSFTSGGTTQLYANQFLLKTGDVAENIVYVGEVDTTTGAWAAGTAAGTLSVIPAGEFSTGDYDLVDADGAVIQSDILTVDDVNITASHAGLWKANLFTESPYTGGWEAVRLGFSLGFEDATIYGPLHIARRGQFSDYTTDVTQAPGHGTTGSTANAAGTGGHTTGTWTITPVGNVPASVNNATGTTNRASCAFSGTLEMSNNATITLGAVDIPDFAGDSTINVKGLEIQVRQVNLSSPGFEGNVIMDGEIQTSGSTITGTTIQTRTLPAAVEDSVIKYGGPEDLWGLADDTVLKAVLDPTTFGVKFTPKMTPPNSSATYSNTVRLYDIKVVIYYTQTITQYYFYDGVDDVIADITYQYTTSTDDGSWAEGGSGILQVTNITASGAATRNYISIGDEIRTGPLGTGLLIATVSTELSYNGLDTLADIEATNSRYEMIVSNFYADEDFEAIYGVSGAGRAFSYDGFYFTRIFTQASETKDKPRHVASFQFHLALGYNSGAVLLSVAGNPLDYLGVNGATEVDTGDPVKGFAKMQGSTLGIFCEDTVQGLVGSSPDNFTLTVLGPYEGVIEYTLGVAAGRPIYCSYRGISFFDQTAAYGDFAGQRLSFAVTPWLLPRLQGTVSPLGVNAAASGPVCAIVNRSDNQYQLYFGDGACLTMTLVGPNLDPQFTIQARGLYTSDETHFGNGTYLGNLVPRAESSFVDDTGAERIHLAHYSEAVPLDTYYVYESNRSFTFNGSGIPAYIVTNENFFNSPFNYDVVRKLRLHGLSMGYAPITERTEKDYNPNRDMTYPAREAVNSSLPREPDSAMYTDLLPVTCMSDIATRGRSFSMRFASYYVTSQPAGIEPAYADVCPPFVLQALLPQHTENKGDI